MNGYLALLTNWIRGARASMSCWYLQQGHAAKHVNTVCSVWSQCCIWGWQKYCVL